MFFKKSKFDNSNIDFLIVGLGNPGDKYDLTRHNIGFMTIDYMADKLGVKLNKLKFKALYNTVDVNGKKLLLAKPQTFMNNSGESVRDIASFYKIPPEKTLIIFDDISLEPGLMRIRRKGSDGGHNGIKNIIYLTGVDTYPRIKMGVGAKPHPDYDLADWVLSKFKKDDITKVEDAVKKAYDAALLIADGQIDKAMNLYNS
ncbi:MAG: aminoacyl-tRNA hydrolase [Clostridia bacterium]|nr:aminoacyl-tRNA hydrolase [Clostridia bacterium]